MSSRCTELKYVILGLKSAMSTMISKSTELVPVRFKIYGILSNSQSIKYLQSVLFLALMFSDKTYSGHCHARPCRNCFQTVLATVPVIDNEH